MLTFFFLLLVTADIRNSKVGSATTGRLRSASMVRTTHLIATSLVATCIRIIAVNANLVNRSAPSSGHKALKFQISNFKMSLISIYQVLVRLFGNNVTSPVFNGSREENGVGKMSAFTPRVTEEKEW